MGKERITVYITERQKAQWEKRSHDEDLPMAEILRRALDTYLAWDDATYTPNYHAPKGTSFSPLLRKTGALRSSL